MSDVTYQLNHKIAFSEPELSKVRVAMLAEYEEYFRTRRVPKNARFLSNPKKRAKAKKGEVEGQPLYIDNDFLDDPLYKGLSITAKLAWISMIQEEHRNYSEEIYQIATRPSKQAVPALAERTIKSLIWLTAFDTMGGKVLTIEDLRSGVEELKAVDLIHVDANNKVGFPKYVSFGKPPSSKN
ncbi:MAG: hypothetical protein WCD37_01945 [Chloroflexia bacterium]